MPSSHLILGRPLLLLPPIPPSIRIFSYESTSRMRWPKYWSFILSISPSNEHPGLVSLGWTGWISLMSKGLLRVFSNAIVQKHQFFSTQLSLVEGNGNPLQYSCLENPMDMTERLHFHTLEKEMATHSSRLENPRDGGAWWAAVYVVAQSRTRLKQLSSSSSSSSSIEDNDVWSKTLRFPLYSTQFFKIFLIIFYSRSFLLSLLF